MTCTGFILILLCTLRGASTFHSAFSITSNNRRTCRRWSVLFGGQGFGKQTKKPTTPSLLVPMNRTEVEEWMSHIPVYAVTDEQGNGQVLKVGDDDVFYFFLSPIMANAHLDQLIRSTNKPLTVSGFFLGKIWFDLISKSTSNNEQDTDYRLVPDSRDLMTARSMSSGFDSIYDDIPLFCMTPKGASSSSKDTQKLHNMMNDLVSSNYMFFSAHNMLATVKSEEEKDDSSANTVCELKSLHHVVDKMMKTGEFRNVVLIPSIGAAKDETTPVPVPDSVLKAQLTDPTSFMASTFFHPLFS